MNEAPLAEEPPRPEPRPAHPGPWVYGILLGVVLLTLGILTIPAAQPALADDPPRRLAGFVYGLPVLSLVFLALSVYMVVWAGRRWRGYRARTTASDRRSDLIAELRAAKLTPPVFLGSLALATLVGIAFPVWAAVVAGSAQVLLLGQFVLILASGVFFAARRLLRIAWARSAA